MNIKLDGKFNPRLHSKPWFFSGKVPEIPRVYSVSGLTPQNYPIRVRSLMPGRKQDQISRQRTYKNIDEQSKQESEFIYYKEYDFIQPNQTIVTIEHCDNCNSHNITTRHDASRYAMLAQRIKGLIISRFPIVKVLQKPLSTLNRVQISDRIGAFEIQAYTKGKQRKLHSKLDTKIWPDPDNIISQLAEFMPKANLKVQVHDQTNPDEFLSNVTVTVTPIQKKNGLIRPQSSNLRSKITSRSTFRDQRSQMRSGQLSQRSLTKRTDSSRASSARKQRLQEQLLIRSGLTREQGICWIQDLPLDTYEIVVNENSMYYQGKRTFNMFSEVHKDYAFECSVALNPKNLCDFSLQLFDLDNGQFIQDAQIVLLGKQELLLKEKTRGEYQNLVPRGKYQMLVKKHKFKESIAELIIDKPNIHIVHHLQAKEVKLLNVYALDAITGDYIGAAKIQLWINGREIPYEGLTYKGKYSFTIESLGIYQIRVEKKKYLIFENGLLVENDISQDIFIPLVQSEKYQNQCLITLNSNLKADTLNLNVLSYNSKINRQFPIIQGARFHNLLEVAGILSISFNPEEFSNQWFRVFIEFDDLDINSAQVGINIYHRNRHIQSINCFQQINTIWDIGALQPSTGEFIETNAMIPNLFQDPLEHIGEFKKLNNFVLDSQCTINQLFLFDQIGFKKQINYLIDTLLTKESFFQQLKNILNNESLDYIIHCFGKEEGISLNLIRKRFDKLLSSQNIRSIKQQNIEQYALLLGMDLIKDQDLMWIPRKGYIAPLPHNWEVFTGNQGEVIYKNFTTGQVQQQNPNNQVYRQLYLQEKAKQQSERNLTLEKLGTNKKIKQEKIIVQTGQTISEQLDQSFKKQQQFAYLFDLELQTLKEELRKELEYLNESNNLDNLRNLKEKLIDKQEELDHFINENTETKQDFSDSFKEIKNLIRFIDESIQNATINASSSEDYSSDNDY